MKPESTLANSDYTLVVVEDDVIARMVISDYLRKCGYEVIEASNAAEAIAVLSADEPVDLVFADIQLPGEWDGLRLAEWIRQHRRDTTILLTSGYAKSAELAGKLCLPGSFMSKPYQPADAGRQIADLLAHRASGSNVAKPPKPVS